MEDSVIGSTASSEDAGKGSSPFPPTSFKSGRSSVNGSSPLLESGAETPWVFESPRPDQFVRTIRWGRPHVPGLLLWEGNHMRSWLKPSTVKSMSIEDTAWLAGIVDGEGTLRGYYGTGRKGRYKSWKLIVPNTFYGMLTKCRRITGVGSINKKPRIKGHKQQWQWVVYGQRNINSIAKQMFPYLTAKKIDTRVFLKQFRDI